MTLSWKYCWSVCALLLIAACGGGSSGDTITDPPDPTFDEGILGFINTISDSPTLAVSLGSSTQGVSGENSVFGDVNLQRRTVAGFDVVVGYPDDDGQTIELLRRTGDDNIKLFRDDETIVWFTGTLANPSVVVVENEEYLYAVDRVANPDVAPQIQVFNGATVGSVDVYYTDVADDLSASTPLASLAQGANSVPLDVAENSTGRLRVTPVGDTSTVLYDSGSFQLTTNTRVHAFVTDYFGPAGTGVTLRVVANRADVAFPNDSNVSEVQLRNVIADATTADLHEGTPAGNPIVGGVPFRGTGTGQNVTTDAEIDLFVTVDGMDDNVVFEAETTIVSRGRFLLAYVGGLESDDSTGGQNVRGALSLTELRPIANGIQVQAFNGSVAAGAIDIYLLGPGETTASETPDLSLAFGALDSIFIPAGDYSLVVTTSGGTDAQTGPDAVTLAPNNFYTLIMSDQPGGSGPFESLLEALPL